MGWAKLIRTLGVASSFSLGHSTSLTMATEKLPIPPSCSAISTRAQPATWWNLEHFRNVLKEATQLLWFHWSCKHLLLGMDGGEPVCNMGALKQTLSQDTVLGGHLGVTYLLSESKYCSSVTAPFIEEVIIQLAKQWGLLYWIVEGFQHSGKWADI